jgi:hypothetical protein
MNIGFDLDRLRLPPSVNSAPVSAITRPPRHRSGEKFLKGPIPLSWLSAAATQAGKALHVGLALWFLAGVKRNRTIALSAPVLSSFGVGRYAGYRGLKALERVGLVSVVRHPGRLPIVTILDGPADNSRAADAQCEVGRHD